jgi:3-hydroxyacyl-CoA dehydrogenase
MAKIENIAVIGAGLMGHGLAQIFAVHGYPVKLMDIKEDLLGKAMENVRSNLTLMAEKGIGTLDDVEPAIGRIKTTTDLEGAVAGAQFVVEAVLENLELKQNIFKDLDAICLPRSPRRRRFERESWEHISGTRPTSSRSWK